MNISYFWVEHQTSGVIVSSTRSRLSLSHASYFPWGTNLERAFLVLWRLPYAYSRPSIKWKYRVLVTLFAVIMLYLLGAAVACILEASKQGGNTYRVMLFSIIITYGSWAASSLLAFDPWHMITSILQYLLLSPFYVNLLNMYVFLLKQLVTGSDYSWPSSYAFANLDDVSISPRMVPTC